MWFECVGSLLFASHGMWRWSTSSTKKRKKQRSPLYGYHCLMKRKETTITFVDRTLKIVPRSLLEPRESKTFLSVHENWIQHAARLQGCSLVSMKIGFIRRRCFVTAGRNEQHQCTAAGRDADGFYWKKKTTKRKETNSNEGFMLLKPYHLTFTGERRLGNMSDKVSRRKMLEEYVEKQQFDWEM